MEELIKELNRRQLRVQLNQGWDFTWNCVLYMTKHCVASSGWHSTPEDAIRRAIEIYESSLPKARQKVSYTNGDRESSIRLLQELESGARPMTYERMRLARANK